MLLLCREIIFLKTISTDENIGCSFILFVQIVSPEVVNLTILPKLSPTSQPMLYPQANKLPSEAIIISL